MNDSLTLLGKPVPYRYDNPDKSILKIFPNPFVDPTGNAHEVIGTISIEVPEFTCLCPITGQPDFATLLIDYRPDRHCLESKSLKYYIGSFRQYRAFHEACVNRIANDLIDVLDPLELTLEGVFAARGGIPFKPIARYRKKNRTTDE